MGTGVIEEMCHSAFTILCSNLLCAKRAKLSLKAGFRAGCVNSNVSVLVVVVPQIRRNHITEQQMLRIEAHAFLHVRLITIMLLFFIFGASRVCLLPNSGCYIAGRIPKWRTSAGAVGPIRPGSPRKSSRTARATSRGTE